AALRDWYSLQNQRAVIVTGSLERVGILAPVEINLDKRVERLRCSYVKCGLCGRTCRGSCHGFGDATYNRDFVRSDGSDGTGSVQSHWVKRRPVGAQHRT